MTIEMVRGRDGKGGFVWPEVVWPEDGVGGVEKGMEREREREKRVEEERRRGSVEERGGLEPVDKGGLRERAGDLLRGRARWRSSWVEDGGEGVVAMGRGERG